MSAENLAPRSTTPRRPGGERWTVFPEWSPELLKARVYERILLDIILCVLAPGSRLDEQDLARRYDAGLAGVREALGRLALEGLVVRRAPPGPRVPPPDFREARKAVDAGRLMERIARPWLHRTRARR